MSKQQIYKIIVTITTAIVTCVAIGLGLTSCNVTRTITTQSQYYQRDLVRSSVEEMLKRGASLRNTSSLTADADRPLR